MPSSTRRVEPQLVLVSPSTSRRLGAVTTGSPRVRTNRTKDRKSLQEPRSRAFYHSFTIEVNSTVRAVALKRVDAMEREGAHRGCALYLVTSAAFGCTTAESASQALINIATLVETTHSLTQNPNSEIKHGRKTVTTASHHRQARTGAADHALRPRHESTPHHRGHRRRYRGAHGMAQTRRGPARPRPFRPGRNVLHPRRNL